MPDLLDQLPFATLPPAAEALRGEVKAFLAEHLPKTPPHKRARSWLGFDADFSRALARRGWVGLTLPREYGGGGRDAFSRYVLAEELLAVGAPVGAHWIAERQSGPLILRFGDEAQRRFYLPRICAGEASFCIGMSEPQAGSDLAAVRSRATRDGSGKGWRLNGRKIWTTNAHRCHYSIALVRTSGAAEDRHKGLSQFIVDLKLPGITIRPIPDLTGDGHFCEMFFDDVRLADEALVGAEGQGWEQVTAELAFERSGPERLYSSVVLLDAWVAWLRARVADSGAGDGAVHGTGHGAAGARAEAHALTLGRMLAQLAALRQMSIAVTARLAAGESPVVLAALVKDLGTVLEQEMPAMVEAALGENPGGAADAELLRTLAYISHMAPTYSLRGGTREVLRGMIARGLGLR